MFFYVIIIIIEEQLIFFLNKYLNGIYECIDIVI